MRGLLLSAVLAIASQPAVPNTVMAVATSNTPVLLTPSSTTPLRVAAVGTLFRVLSEQGDWVQVEFRDPQLGNRVGFVSRKHVRLHDPQLEPTDLSVGPPRTPVHDGPPRTASTNTSRPSRIIEGGILDEIRLFTDVAPRAGHVLIRPFSATDKDIREGDIKEQTRAMQASGPGMLARRFVAKLREIGPVGNVAILGDFNAPSEGLVVEGRFCEIDPGSRAKRYFVGFGAGKSAVAVEGTVRDADGSVRATFQQRRVGVMGAFGGDSMGKLTSDVNAIGEDIAEFINAWLRGQPLK